MGFLSRWGNRQTATALVAILVIVLSGVSAFAQGNTGRITGMVQDPSGAVVPNAKITATNVKTQATKEATSNEQGNYVITAVQPGVYTLTATAAGFSKELVTNLAVEVSGTAEVDFKMKVGSGSVTVEVTANTVAVQTAESSKSSVISMKDIDTLPSLGRTPITLAVFQPGVQLNPGDVSFSRINGQRQGSNNTTLDGIDVNDSVVPRLGLSLTANNTDSVGEFRIITQGAKAEYGRNAGGQVELITRTGGNSFHGNGFDYLRNTVLNANDYFNKNTLTPTERPKFIQNIFGGSFGGPIKHNRLFIFGNYQGRRARQEVIRNRTVYTDNARTGLFTYKNAAGVVQTYNIVANDPRAKGIDPAIVNIIGMVPHSNNCDVGDGLNTCGFRFNNANNSYEDQFTIKGDANITDKMKVFLRWSWQRNAAVDSLNNADATFPGQVTGTQGGHRWGNSMGHDWTITNTLVNEFRYGHQSAQVAFNRPARLSGPTIITNLITDPIQSAFAQGRNSPVDDFLDNVTKTWGNHIFKFGGKYSHTKQYGYNFAGVYPNVTTAAASGNVPTIPAALSTLSPTDKTRYQSLYNDLLGRMDAVALTFYSTDLATWQTTGSPSVRNYILNEHGYYFQDDWKVFRNLTVNIGLRWELFLPPTEMQGIQAGIVNPQAITATNTATNLVIATTSQWFKTDWNNFAPRVGFAWDIRGDGKTALRGNYGLFYDRIIGSAIQSQDAGIPGFASGSSVNPQTFATAAAVTAAGCGSAPVGDIRIADCIPSPAQPAAPVLTFPCCNTSKATNVTMLNPNLRTGYVHSFGLNIQREIARNTIIEAGYIGNLGVKLFLQQDFNQPRINEDFLGAFQQIQVYQNTGALPSATNSIVKIFLPQSQSAANATYAPLAGQPCSAQPNPTLCATNQALNQVGATVFANGQVGTAADTIDRSTTFNGRYAGAGLPSTYLRNYPQFRGVRVGGNSGRSYYHALQLSVRRNTGALRMAANYTYSHSIDNAATGNNDSNGFTSTVDNFNLLANRSTSDTDHRHSFNASMSYSLPIGAGKRFGGGMNRALDTVVGGWDMGATVIVQDGVPFTVSSGRLTVGNVTANTFANYTGDRSGGPHYQANNTIYWFTPDQIANFGYPAAGTYGTSGRNGFRGPGYFDVDMSLVKRFKITERHVITFRAEAYNLLNKPNFTNPGVALTNIASCLANKTCTDVTAGSNTFGKISGTTGPAGTSARNLQLTLRYDF